MKLKYLKLTILFYIILNSNIYGQYKHESISPKTRAYIAKAINVAGFFVPMRVARLDKDLVIPFYLFTAFTSSSGFLYLESRMDYWQQSLNKLAFHAATASIIYLTTSSECGTSLIERTYCAFKNGLIAYLFLGTELSYLFYDDFKRIDQITKSNVISSRLDILPNFVSPGLTLSYSF